MGGSQYPWWSYVQSMIRNYPERLLEYDSLKRVERMETDAVRAAMDKTLEKEDGRERLHLVQRFYWELQGRKTMEGVAMDLYISRATAFRWSAEFLELVAEEFGIYDPE